MKSVKATVSISVPFVLVVGGTLEPAEPQPPAAAGVCVFVGGGGGSFSLVDSEFFSVSRHRDKITPPLAQDEHGRRDVLLNLPPVVLIYRIEIKFAISREKLPAIQF